MTSSSDPAELRRPADVRERAYLVIRKSLTEFKLKPEERINELQLARSLGISRTPIREALSRLASEGFVTIVPNRGFFSRALDIDSLLNTFELRSIVECGAFVLMCKRADDESLGRLKSYWQDASTRYARRNPDEILELDEGFHLLMAELSGNPQITQTLSSINAHIRFIRRIQIEHVSHDEDFIAMHSLIVEAAVARNIAEGTGRLKQHIELSVAATQQALKDALMALYTADKPTKRANHDAPQSRHTS